MIRTITVPAAGQSKSFGITGRSIIIERAELYESIVDVPLLSFDQPGRQLPGIIRSRYGNWQGGCCCGFDKITVTGTAASAGDEITIFSTTACLEDFINFDALQTTKIGIGPGTRQKVSTDVATALSNAELINSDGELPHAMAVSALVADIRYAIGSDPNQEVGTAPEAAGHFLPADGEPKRVEGLNLVTDFRIISAAGATPGVLNYTCEFN